MEDQNIKVSLTKLGVRHIQVTLMFIMLTIGYGMRVSMSVAVVAMTDNTTSSNPDIPTYKWTNKGYILSSFFWGYVTLQVVAGQLGKMFGTKEILMVAMFLTSLSFTLIPVAAATTGSYGVIFLRVLGGMTQGFFVPSVYGILGKWVPLTERSRLGTVAISGGTFGTIVAMPLVGYLSSSYFGWPSAFYLFGSLGFVWIVIWYFFGASNPGKHWSISEAEREYIETALNLEDKTQPGKTPWVSILTSVPLWAIITCNIGQNWGYITLVTETASYLNKVMKFDIQADGLLSAAPYLAACIGNFLFGFLADYCINKNYFSVEITRKIFTSIGSFGPAAALLILSYLPDGYTTLSVIMIILAVSIGSGICGGIHMNYLDLSPRYAGISLAISNSVATASALLAPIVVQTVVIDETSKSEWRVIFIIAAILFAGTAVVYIIFGSGEAQSWDSAEKDKHGIGQKSNVNAPTKNQQFEKV